MPVPAQHGWGMSVETAAPCSFRRWGKDEEVEGRYSDAAPIVLQARHPELRGGKGEAAAGGEAESGASPGSFPNERLERKLGIVQVKQGRRKFVNSFFLDGNTKSKHSPKVNLQEK